MALTVGEASAVNTLIRFITQETKPHQDAPPSSDAARAAANLLAKSADKRLMAGYRGNGDVDRIWPAASP